MFSCEYINIFKNTYFEEHMLTIASASYFEVFCEDFVDISYENA